MVKAEEGKIRVGVPTTYDIWWKGYGAVAACIFSR